MQVVLKVFFEQSKTWKVFATAGSPLHCDGAATGKFATRRCVHQLCRILHWENSCRISWGRSLFLKLGTQSRLLKNTSTKKRTYFWSIIFNLLHGLIKMTASGLAWEKTPNLIITYTGTLIKLTCYYNRAHWKGLGQKNRRSFFFLKTSLMPYSHWPCVKYHRSGQPRYCL